MAKRRPWLAEVSGRAVCALGLAIGIGAGVLSPGCDAMREDEPPPAAPPAPTFTGPRHLQGTIASVASLRGFEPQYVSGYGLVVGLNNTGADGAPPFLRQWLINEMKKGGMGSMRFDTLNLAPELVLTSRTAAPVVIEGFIPPGAVKGTRFDVLVSALDGTTTTSLRDGTLYTFDLSENGANPQLRYSTMLARASGAAYIDPLEDLSAPKTSTKHEQMAVVLSGGDTAVNRQIELILNQPSYNRARLIADRINDRFKRNPRLDKEDVANPISDSIIQIRVTSKYARDPERLLRLIGKLYVQRGPGFEEMKAEQMANIAIADPKLLADIEPVWEALGELALPVIRRYYGYDRLDVRLAALEAGVKLGDDMTLGDEVNRGRLIELASHPDANVRRRVADLLTYMPGNMRASQSLRRLLSDPEKSVRFAAYEAMASNGDTTLHRMPFGDPGRVKFVLDIVPSDRPMVYVTQANVPRIAVFGQMTAFNTPMLARLWDNQLMIRQGEPGTPVEVYYQNPLEVKGKKEEIKAPSLASLIYLLGHKPKNTDDPGFDFTYSQVVNVLYLLNKEKSLACEMEVQLNPIAQLVSRARQDSGATFRPETGGTSDAGDKARPDTGRPATGRPASSNPEGTPPSDATRPPVILP